MSRQVLFFTSIAGVIVAMSLFFVHTGQLPVIPLHSVTVAQTETARERGLSGVMSLSEDAGMLFVFDHADRYGFWMKDMHIPIDIIWLDDLMHIVDVDEHISPATFPEIFRPATNSRFVLEVTAGNARSKHYVVGRTLDFLKKYVKIDQEK